MEQVGELIARRLGCDREDDVLAALRSRSVDDDHDRVASGVAVLRRGDPVRARRSTAG